MSAAPRAVRLYEACLATVLNSIHIADVADAPRVGHAMQRVANDALEKCEQLTTARAHTRRDVLLKRDGVDGTHVEPRDLANLADDLSDAHVDRSMSKQK